MFVTYAAISLVPVLALGAVLAMTYRSEAQRRGLAEGRSEAALVAHVAVEPALDGRPLGAGLSDTELAALHSIVRDDRSDHSILRLRLRDLSGRVVFADDGSGLTGELDDEAVDAAHGEIVTKLTRLNNDANDTGPRGVSAVEAYRLLTAGLPARPVGVLELYLPYTPIRHDVTSGLRGLYRDLALGLTLLYLAAAAISFLVSRGLRRQLAVNEFLAKHDPLTELPNRALFHARAAKAVAVARVTGARTAIGIVDLDRFKEVNDTLGHHNGDRVLTALAGRLADGVRPQDTVARLGGDEFGVILCDVDDTESALHRLRDLIDCEVDIDGLPISVEASIGFVVAPDDGEDVDELLQRADVAMYVAKSQHVGVLRYDPRDDHYDAVNLELIAQLRHAIDDDQLVLHYQPKVSMHDGHVDAVEALVRWQHPTHGLLPPDAFLPLVEPTDLIDRLTDWVLAHAVQEVNRIDPALAVAVNVSARNLVRRDFAARVVATLDRLGVPPARLIVEITETALLTDPAGAAHILGELSAAGVRVSLDDFGQGQTSLGYLSALPIHELKIDKSFVCDLLTNAGHAAIVRSIADLGHNLGLRVVGEGVETAEVLEGLRQAGADVAQGYLFARPLPPADLQQWLLDGGARRAAPAARALPSRGV